MQTTEEYNNGKPIDVGTIDKSNMSLAVSEWAEGSESLKIAIESCLANNINTRASCKGHNLFAVPYLAMVVTKENMNRILNIMNSINNMNNVRMTLSYSDFVRIGGERKTILSIYGNMLNRNSLFKTIAESANAEIPYEKLSEDVKVLWDFHMAMRKHGYGFDHNAVFAKGMFGKMTEVVNYFNNYGINDLLEKNGFKPLKGPRAQYYKRAKPKKAFELLIEEIDDYFTDRKDNEFDDMDKQNEKEKNKDKEFIKSIKAEVQSKNNEDMSREKIEETIEEEINK